MSLSERLASLSPEQRLLVELVSQRKVNLESSTETPARSATVPAFDLISETDRSKIPPGVGDAYPAARLQLAMLYHLEMTSADEIPAYHNVNSFHVEARFDEDCFRRAVERVTARNPMMRTSFDLTGFSEPMQLVHESVEPTIRIEDLRDRESTVEKRAALEHYWDDERQDHFDVSKPPLMRFAVHVFNDHEFHLTLTELHAISEGWGTANILAEISDVYFPLLHGEPPPELPPPAVTYREFIRLEREALASEASQEFWQKKLDGCTVVRPPRWPAELQTRRSTGRKLQRTVPAEVASALYRFGSAAGIPAKSVTLAIHLKVMSIITGQTDLLVGIQCHGRPEELGGDEVHGVFINTVPFRCDCSPGSWADLARRAFETETELLPHRRFPLAALQQAWGEDALIETNFTYLHFHSIRRLDRSENFRLRGGEGVDLSVTHFPLMVAFHLMEGGDPPPLLFFLERDDAELTSAQGLAYLGYYQRVVQALAEEPDAGHHLRSFLSPAERHQAVYEWNDTAVERDPSPRLLHELVEAQVRRTPDAVAVSFEGQALTYAELDRRAERLADYLLRSGERPEVVALFLDRSLEMVVALLGILKAGGAYLPLDPDYPRGALAFVLQQSGSRMVLTTSRLRDRLPRTETQVVELDGELDGGDSGSTARISIDPEDLAYAIYTSGTTGQPKGVMNVHAAIVNRVLWMQDAYKLTPQDRVLQKTPYSFDVSVWEFFLPLATGARLVVARPEGHKDSVYLAQTIVREAITTLHFVPSMLQIFLEEPEARQCQNVKRIISSGEALPFELAQSCLETLGCELHNLYGPTEAAVDVTFWDCRSQAHAGLMPIGRPIANAAIHVLDTNLYPAPLAVPGELHIGGRPLARGYLANPVETVKRFIPDSLSGAPGTRLYRTGDLVRRLPDGIIEYLGRNDHQVKLRGFRIELPQIEAQLEQHTRVQRAVVMLRQDGGEGRLVAYIVPAPEAEPNAALLRTFLRGRLPEYMVPSAFVLLEKLPLTANGKVDRKALPEPSQDRPDMQQDLVLPRNPTERTLAELWQEVLQIQKIGVFDNFFDLGGDSLSLLRLHRLVRQKLDDQVAITEMFRHPTIAAFAESLSKREEKTEVAFERETQRAESRKEAATRQRQRRLKRSRIREI